MVHKLVKRLISGALALTLVFSINGFAAVVTDSDGSSFITKAEFDSLKNSFQAQIDSYNQAIDSKIDGAIAAYLAGIKQSTMMTLEDLYSKYKITGVKYDDGNLYWSATRNGLLNKDNAGIGWKASIAYSILNIKLTAGTYTTAQEWTYPKTYTGFASLINWKKDYTNNMFVEEDGFIKRASNRKYWMNTSLIWQSVARNASGDRGSSYSASGSFYWNYFKGDTTIDRKNGSVWSQYRGNEGDRAGGAVTFGYTSFSIEDVDLANTVCAAVYAGDAVKATGDPTYYVDNVDIDNITVNNSNTQRNIYTDTDYTFTTPDGCTSMSKTSSTSLGYPGAITGSGMLEEREPNVFKFKDFINICDKNDQMKNGVCVVNELPTEGTLRFRLRASAAGQLIVYSGNSAKLNFNNKKESITKTLVAGDNSFDWDKAETGDYVAIRYIPNSGVGKLENFKIQQIVSG